MKTRYYLLEQFKKTMSFSNFVSNATGTGRTRALQSTLHYLIARQFLGFSEVRGLLCSLMGSARCAQFALALNTGDCRLSGACWEMQG